MTLSLNHTEFNKQLHKKKVTTIVDMPLTPSQKHPYYNRSFLQNYNNIKSLKRIEKKITIGLIAHFLLNNNGSRSSTIFTPLNESIEINGNKLQIVKKLKQNELDLEE